MQVLQNEETQEAVETKQWNVKAYYNEIDG